MYYRHFIEFIDKKKLLAKNGKDERNILSSNKIEFTKFLKTKKQKFIPYKIIRIFYEKPQIFFKNHKIYLKNYSFFDNCGFSIFNHYFYVLLDNKVQNKEIYEQNFSQFFKDYKDGLLIQDYYLDTPLHKLAKMNNKKYFLFICDKLNEIGILNEKLLNMPNSENMSCLNYIMKFIYSNYVTIIKKNEYANYKLIINFYSNLAPSDNEKIIINTFEDGFYYNYVNFSEIKFENFYGDIMKLIENKKEYIYKIISSFAKQNINYLNFLYQLCEKKDDFDKLFILIKNYLIQKNNLERCIFRHVSYVLRKMNSTNKKGDNEIIYGVNLLKFILDEKIRYKDEKRIHSILLNRKMLTKQKISKNIFKEGLIYNLIYNPNLSFKNKSEIFSIFKKFINFNSIFKELSSEEFIQFYNFFELIENNEINKKNIINLYNTNECFKNIISKFFEYKNIYQIIIKLCKEINDKKYDEYIYLMNEIILKKIPFYFKYYLPNTENKIFKFIILYSEQEYEMNPIDNNFNFEKNKIINDLLSNENFTLCLLKNIIKNSFEKNYTYFFKIIFNSEFYLGNFINEYNSDIQMMLSKINFENENKRIELTKTLNLKNIYELIPILEKYPLIYKLTATSKELYTHQINNQISIKYYNVFLFFADYFKDLNFLSETKKYIIFDIKNIIKTNLIFFINNWNQPFAFDEFINQIENNILI